MPQPTPPKMLDTCKLDNSFHVARARAIERYAAIEQCMARLVAVLLGADPALAWILFFKITTVAYRNKALEQLLNRRYASKYAVYWHGRENQKDRGLFDLIRQLDNLRNPIIHWHTELKAKQEGDHAVATHFELAPNVWERSPDHKNITTEDMNEFSVKAEFVAGSIAAFSTFLVNHNDFPTRAMIEAWPQIFSQPVSYPPLDTHPLSQNYKEP